ncbi:putative aldouronate transport system permease protein [Lachnospiraceae bacterium NK3A20]|nr:putative aldouronate transport system permease protein [Lachnospiraceae bacterium NK3A20]
METDKRITSTAGKGFYHIYRFIIVALVIMLFIPGLNPSRIAGIINRNISLLTTSFSYATLTNGMGRAMRKGWVLESTMRTLQLSGLGITLGILLGTAGACLSLGNDRCHRISTRLTLTGTILALLSCSGIFVSYGQIALTEKPSKVAPMFPTMVVPLIVALVILLVVSVILLFKVPKSAKHQPLYMESRYYLFLLLLPFLALVFVFNYLPLWGWRYAFFDYHAGDTLSLDNFVGFKWFRELIANKSTVKDVGNVMKNTLAMSGLGIATSWLPMAFAIFLNEVKHSRFRKFVQTFTTIPNFISWVLVFSIAFAMFSTDGFLSSIMINTGVWKQGQNLLMDGSHTWLKMLLWGTWKGLGWSAIIYIAGISGIDQQLYEAATVDGASRFQRMWHVTVPGLLPTFFVLLLMSVANILSNGMEQYLVFENSNNSAAIMVLDLYVYKMGIVNGNIPISTVLSMLKSVVSVVLLFVANGASKLIRGESII